MTHFYEEILDTLLAETKIALEEEYEKLVLSGGFDAKDNPLGVSDAKEILLALLYVAHDMKNRISGRMVEGIIKGASFEDYYSGIVKIDQLNTELSVLKTLRKDAEDEYYRILDEYNTALAINAPDKNGESVTQNKSDDDEQWGGLFG